MRYQKDDFIRALVCLVESVFMVDEGVQVHGIIPVIDFCGYTIKHQTNFSLEERRQYMQAWQVGLLLYIILVFYRLMAF